MEAENNGSRQLENLENLLLKQIAKLLKEKKNFFCYYVLPSKTTHFLCPNCIQKQSLRRSSRSEVFYKKEVLLKFLQNSQKKTSQSLFFKKRGSGTGVFLWIVKNTFFDRTPLDNCFCTLYLFICPLMCFEERRLFHLTLNMFLPPIIIIHVTVKTCVSQKYVNIEIYLWEKEDKLSLIFLHHLLV